MIRETNFLDAENLNGFLVKDSPGGGSFDGPEITRVDTGPGEMPDGSTEPKNTDTTAPQSQNLADPGPTQKEPVSSNDFSFKIAGFNGFIVLALAGALIAILNFDKVK